MTPPGTPPSRAAPEATEQLQPPRVARWSHDLISNHTTRQGAHDALYGYDEDLPSWSQEIFLDCVHPDDRSQVLAALAGATVQGFLDMTFRVIWPNGTERWLRSVGITDNDDRGEAVRMEGVLFDVTDSKALESDVDELRTNLARAQKLAALGGLVSGIVHDFNNLLTVIIGGSEALRTSAGSADDRELATMLLNAGERGGDLTRRLLAIDHPYAGRVKAVRPASVVSEVAALLRRSLPPGVDLEVRNGDHPALVDADPALLEAAILNLAVNSIAAIDTRGVVTIGVDPLPTTGEVAISVADSGHGMSPDVQQHVFDQFFTTRAGAGGTGGLSMVASFVQGASGRVTVESEPGVGTVVQIVLPEAAATSAIETEPDDSIPVRGGIEHLLLVEDDPDVRQLALLALRSLGYHVRQASTADEAWDIWLSTAEARSSGDGRIELVVANAETFGASSGVELAARIRGIEPELPIVLTTSLELTETDEATPPATLLRKPYRSRELTTLVREILDGRPPGPDRAARGS